MCVYVYLQSVILFSHKKARNPFMCASTWISLENGIETELNQAEKDTSRTLPLTRGAGNEQIRREAESRGGHGAAGGGALLFKGTEFHFGTKTNFRIGQSIL